MPPADLAAVAARLPWPNVRGKRCLDVGPSATSLADELEQRGAAEVVARQLDAPHRTGAAPASLEAAPSRPGVTPAELEAGALGRFDVVVVGGGLLLLEDPVGALRALRAVTAGVLLWADPIELWLSVLARGKALAAVGDGPWAVNGAGQKRLLELAGFSVERVSKPFVRPSGAGPRPTGVRSGLDRVAQRVLTGSPAEGTLHRALLARPCL